MRRAITTIAAIATLVLVVKVLVTPSRTVADTQETKSPIQNAMSIYDMHVGYSNMNTLRADQTPSP